MVTQKDPTLWQYHLRKRIEGSDCFETSYRKDQLGLYWQEEENVPESLNSFDMSFKYSDDTPSLNIPDFYSPMAIANGKIMSCKRSRPIESEAYTLGKEGGIYGIWVLLRERILGGGVSSCAVKSAELTEELLHVLRRKGSGFMGTTSCINTTILADRRSRIVHQGRAPTRKKIKIRSHVTRTQLAGCQVPARLSLSRRSGSVR